MKEKIQLNEQTLDGLSALIASVPKEGFGKAVLDYISQSARIENFGAFYFSDLTRPKPVLSVWSGRISDYWFQRNAKAILNASDIQKSMVRKMKSAPDDGVIIERWHPSQFDPRRPLFEQCKVLERIGVYSKSGRSGFQSFYLRGTKDGWITDDEFQRLQECLPIVHSLIGLRQQMVGSENFQFTAGDSASSLRERDVAGFGRLSEREAQVCDAAIRGMTVAGTAIELAVSETTIRTLRQRAYRKLGVRSANALLALIVNDTQAN